MEIADDFRINTSGLAIFRELATKHRQLTDVIGHILQLRIVVDANAVISDLRQKILYPERGKTALEELMTSSVLVVIAPRWLEADMNSAIDQYAESSGMSAILLHLHWSEYKKQLVWDETYPRPIDTPSTHVDPKDAPYVFTQWLQNAVGVLSKDKHIEQMGGNRLTLDFVFSVRSYARAKVIALTVKVGGVALSVVAIAVIFELIKALVQGIRRIPPGVQLLLLAFVFFLILNPDARKWIGQRLGRLKAALEPVFIGVASTVKQGTDLARQKEVEAAKHLSEAQSHSGTTLSVRTSLMGVHRRSGRVRASRIRKSRVYLGTEQSGD